MVRNGWPKPLLDLALSFHCTPEGKQLYFYFALFAKRFPFYRDEMAIQQCSYSITCLRRAYVSSVSNVRFKNILAIAES